MAEALARQFPGLVRLFRHPPAAVVRIVETFPFHRLLPALPMPARWRLRVLSEDSVVGQLDTSGNEIEVPTPADLARLVS
jgi:hypothetical protein